MQPRRLPAIDTLLNAPELKVLAAQHGVGTVKDALRALQGELRKAAEVPDWARRPPQYAQRLSRQLAGRGYRVVHNLTGTIIHTNLGRAPLSGALWDAVRPLVTGAMNLEYDLAAGGRGDRDSWVAQRLARLTGAEAATVVNNNAAALVLVLNTLANGRPVPVSRGELIEIGGSFRLPDLMSRAGCQLQEVGATNRTHLKDFAAVAPQAALLLKVHPSNYAIRGFTAEAGTAELAQLAHAHGLALCVDLGSGALVNLARYGLPAEPLPQQVLQAGADLVTFSGDKLLGSVQAGLVLGRADLIAKLNANPLKRALRPDKITLTLLDETLKLYEDAQGLPDALPVLRLLTTPLNQLEARAEALRQVLRGKLPTASLSVQPAKAQIGSGAAPDKTVPSWALVIRPAAGTQARHLEQRLRQLAEPVIGRIRQDALWLDLRSVADFAAALKSIETLTAP